MPSRSKSSGGNDDSFHPLVSQLAPDPNKLPNTVVLSGYPGPSRKEGFLRCYLSLDFQSYVEIPRGGILYIEPFDPSQEASPVKIIINAASVPTLDLVQTLDTSFLKGSVIAAYPPGARRYLGWGTIVPLGTYTQYYTCDPC
jgi:hypothetical protein